MTTFDPAFVEAMKRIEAKRLIPEKKKLLRRHPLLAHEMPNTNFAIYNFIGWIHTRGRSRAGSKNPVTPRVRLYGHSGGEGSFTQVTRGMERALRAAGELAGVCPSMLSSTTGSRQAKESLRLFP